MPTSLPPREFSPPAALPLNKMLRMRQEQIADLTNAEIARRLGYSKPNVIAMMMTGSMNIPIAKVPELAETLQLDPLWLLRRVALEYIPEVWAVIEKVVGERRLVTAEELALLQHLREAMLGEPVDLAADDRFTAGLHDLLASAVDRHLRTALAATETGAGPRPKAAGGSPEKTELMELLRRQAAERRELQKRWRARRS